jgi:hypothetical protein
VASEMVRHLVLFLRAVLYQRNRAFGSPSSTMIT